MDHISLAPKCTSHALCDSEECVNGTEVKLRLPCFALVVALCLPQISCELAYPEVVVVNRTGEHILLKNPCFNGCVWDTVLAFGDATSPGRCLPGEDRIHFQKLDVESYCQEQVEDGTIDGVCPCEPDADPDSDGGIDPGLINEEPNCVGSGSCWAMARCLALASRDCLAMDTSFRISYITDTKARQKSNVYRRCHFNLPIS